jgi:metacaspase-1
MAKGLSLHIGLNAVNPAHYDGWSGELNACEADARDMVAIAGTGKFKSTLLLTKKATRGAVSSYLAKAAKTLAKGDYLLISYSGHGGQVPDRNGDEPDALDETWCLYDGQMIDDELNAAYAKFKAGVRIAVFSDSCHSGSVIKDNLLTLAAANKQQPAIRAMPKERVQSVYLKHKAFYDKLQAKAAVKPGDIAARVDLISGCQDNQTSADGAFNGLFTGTLKTVWNGGAFKKKGYHDLQRAIQKRMPPEQSPNFMSIGAKDPGFDGVRPFSIA